MRVRAKECNFKMGQYFEELNQQLRVPQNDSEYANRSKNLDEKIDIFKTTAPCTGATPFTLPTDIHRLGTLIYNVNSKEIQPVERNEYFLLNRSPLTQPTTSYPLYILEGTGTPSAAPSNVTVFPNTITTNEVDAYYIKAPSDPRWGFSVGSLGQYLYDSATFNTTVGALAVGTGFLTGSITTATAGAIFPATYTNPTFTTSGSGVNATFTITATSATACTIDVTTAGSGYVVGDTITIDGGELGGGSTGPIITLLADDLYSSSTYGSTQFELHPSEQTNIILNILIYLIMLRQFGKLKE